MTANGVNSLRRSGSLTTQETIDYHQLEHIWASGFGVGKSGQGCTLNWYAAHRWGAGGNVLIWLEMSKVQSVQKERRLWIDRL